MILAVDKPTGMTSYDVIRKLKHLYPKQKIGHSGTLDPLATGLLLIGIDKGTKELFRLQGLDKSYEATIDFSQTSDTWDVDFWEIHGQYSVETNTEGIIGIVKDDQFIPAPEQLFLEKNIESIIPEANLPLTPFSAKKKDGKKLYELARAGEIVDEYRIMKINGYHINEYNFPVMKIRLDVGSGTYIRSIAHRLGKQAHMGGILTQLRRTCIGNISLENLDLQDLGDSGLKGCEVFLD
ncbi:MAG: hypothetical protein WCO66_00100 [Candidatus Absconditabacteria bacterium]